MLFSMLAVGVMSVVNIYPSIMVLSLFQMDAEIRLCGPFSTHFLDADVDYRTDQLLNTKPDSDLPLSTRL